MTVQELIPLGLATRLVYLRAHGRLPPRAHLLNRLNGLAYAIARFATIYTIGEWGREARQLSRAELASGLFRGGGAELHFIDERPVLSPLCVTEDGIAKTVDGLLASSAV